LVTITQIVTGKWKENCYIVLSEKKSALIIDPGDEPDKIIQHITKNNLKPAAILNTHAHYDHIGAVVPLKNKYNIPFYIHSKEKSNLMNVNLYRQMIDKLEPISIAKADVFLDTESNYLTIGEFEINVIFTPGHSAGSVCFIIDNNLFCGDLFYKDRIGRTDFPGANASLLKNSLAVISKLPHNIMVFPGHGEMTTLEHVIKNNKEFKKALE
jgi:hydroxyacylglutathione hydrolase